VSDPVRVINVIQHLYKVPGTCRCSHVTPQPRSVCKWEVDGLVSRAVLAAFAGWLGHFLENVRRRFAIGCSAWRQRKKAVGILLHSQTF